MKKNMGTTDRMIRLVIAAVLLMSSLMGGLNPTWNIVALVLAIIMTLTSLVSFCPLYLPFGINTCRKKA
ncbi:MAG: DUF2892 domain-containing protein [Flavobacteriales bacterium]|jgi:hypothetical protein